MPDLRLMHASMQFSDSNQEHRHDASAIFQYARKHNVVFLTGTEGGGDSLMPALADAAKVNGFRINNNRAGDWVAVNTNLAKQTAKGHEKAIPASTGLKAHEGGHASRGITWSTAEVPGIGVVTVGSVHYLTQRSIDATGKSNQVLADEIEKWGREKGRGKALVFCQGDMNMNDAKRDTFLGAPFRSCWDELGKWPGTTERGKKHGATIDLSASYNADGRVSAKSARVLADTDLRLAADHLPLVAVYTVA